MPSDAVTRVLSEVLRAVNDVPLAPEVVNSMRDALSIDVFLGTRTEVLLLREAERVLHASFEHFTGLLAQLRVFLMVRLKVLLPSTFNK